MAKSSDRYILKHEKFIQKIELTPECSFRGLKQALCYPSWWNLPKKSLTPLKSPANDRYLNLKWKFRRAYFSLIWIQENLYHSDRLLFNLQSPHLDKNLIPKNF